MFHKEPEEKQAGTLPEDDSRTIADMNVEGMPWYSPGSPDKLPERKGLTDDLTPEQMRAYRFAAVRAGLLVALVFGVVFFLFLLFCDYIWFR